MGERLVPDQSARLRGERRVHAHEVGAPQQFAEGYASAPTGVEDLAAEADEELVHERVGAGGGVAGGAEGEGESLVYQVPVGRLVVALCAGRFTRSDSDLVGFERRREKPVNLSNGHREINVTHEPVSSPGSQHAALHSQPLSAANIGRSQ